MSHISFFKNISFRAVTALFFTFLLFSCRQGNPRDTIDIDSRLRMVDSLILAGKHDEANSLLNNIRRSIPNEDPALVDFFALQSGRYQFADSVRMQLYADSALSFFTTEELMRKWPKAYYKALLAKGDACMASKHFQLAIHYYYKVKQQFAAGVCDDGELESRMASIYFNQQNYRLGAQCLISSYKKIGACGKAMPQKIFFLSQSKLNGTGTGYQKAGMMDSALLYYRADIALIDKADGNSVIDKSLINASRVVVYDNLGGLYLQNKKITEAEQYLMKCLAIPVKETDGLRIPPYNKLAEVYLITGRYDEAEKCLTKARELLNRFRKTSFYTEVEWNRLYAAYLSKVQQPYQANEYLKSYIRLKDSLQAGTAKLDRLDVARELDSIRQSQAMGEVLNRNKFKRYIILAIAAIVVLLTLVLVLIARSLIKKTRNAQLMDVKNWQQQQMLEELERANKNYIRIMRVMAHDLRNPLSGMTGLAAMLIGEDDFSDDTKHMLHLIESTGLHTMEMINELLKTGLADENETINMQQTDLSALLYDSVELLQFKAAEKRQRIEFNSSSLTIFAPVNHEKIWRVFNNLIVNAIKFSHQQGVIRASIKEAGNHVLISIADDGIGIPEEDRDRVFEMFTSAKKVGTNGEQPFGLGLSISKKIIEKHHGRIWFESIQGTGTTFFVELPSTAHKA